MRKKTQDVALFVKIQKKVAYVMIVSVQNAVNIFLQNMMEKDIAE